MLLALVNDVLPYAGSDLLANAEIVAGPFDGLKAGWEALNHFIVGLAGSPWALVAVFLVAIIDGFFPPVPAETLVIATAAVYSASGLWWEAVVLWAIAAAGALCGDCIAYTLGRKFNASQWRIFRQGKGHSALAWARRVFARGAAPLLMVARFIPVGRVAVNLTAGTVHFPIRRFVLIDGAAALCWGAYSVGVGYLAGQATGENPLLAVAYGVVFAASFGSLVQWLVNRHYGKSLPPDAIDEVPEATSVEGSELSESVPDTCAEDSEKAPAPGAPKTDSQER
ncbi:MAG: DedA family protein [Bifidobacteriaceae bacterium]|jgi:membrane protein DedA with SNARE-associated domain|nr:DedA family protein [Bifidobacteriaceae bacterium]